MNDTFPKLVLTIITIVLYSKSLLAQPNWSTVKASTYPTVSIPSEFGTPYKQNIALGGWEDGVFITRDGLVLYCFYTPIDLLSWTYVGGANPAAFSPYLRSPSLGMDLVSAPFSGPSEWLQSDILIASRNSLSDSFPNWQLSNLHTAIWSEGAPQINQFTSNTADVFVYTSNNVPPNYKTDIVMLQSISSNPNMQGSFLPAPVNSPDTREDNPHLERLNANDLVLFFDSDDRIGGVGLLDIWFSTTTDNGISWTIPVQVSTLNTLGNEQQPHLYKDNTNTWYIYYTGTNTTTGKTEIYRARQSIAGHWDSWVTIESVIGAGNAYAVGEPTLTQYGDISFVVLYEDPINGTSTDKYDSDPWFLPNLNSPLHSNINSIEKSELLIYPNPTSSILNIQTPQKQDDELIMCDLYGRIVLIKPIFDKTRIDCSTLGPGIYFIYLKSHPSTSKKIVIN